MTQPNDIGEFAIGLSQIGTPRWDYTPTILAQYANSPTILSLIESFSDAVDPAADLDNFFDYVWNIDTAQGFGLDILGRIMCVGRVYPVAGSLFLGFEEAGIHHVTGWNQGPWWSGVGHTSNYALADEAYRRLILAKATANILNGGTAAINGLLRLMFPGRGNAYVVDNLDMTMTYKFEFVLSPVDATIVVNSGVLPHPAGIVVNVVRP